MYTTESYKKPFWAENSGFMTGRDPLGIQNSSITTYGRLLPGMTNLTLRLRYYGLYMWLLREYDIVATKDSNRRDQYNFIRRAELIIAFLMMKKFPDEQSIIGSDYTTKKEKEGQYGQLGYYDIQNGADKNKETKKGSVYWDFESGALGQYYAGSLIALKLIDISGKYFRLLDKGKELALAFSENIDPVQKNIFLQIIQSGKLTQVEIDAITDFALNNIPANSEEWKFYKMILISDDGIDQTDNTGSITQLRKNSIRLYLDYIHNEKDPDSDQNFIKLQYQSNLTKSNDDASYGWHYYYINEAFHIALETIFWSILVELEPREQRLESLVNSFIEKTLFEAEKSYLNGKSSLNLGALSKEFSSIDLVELLDELEFLVKSNHNVNNALAKAYLLMIAIYGRYQDRLIELKNFELKYKIWGQKGRVSENLVTYVQNFQDQSFSEFVKESIKIVLNDHINTAYRKMGNGESNLLKFIIEDGLIYHIQTMKPRHTSPRLRALDNFMRDLNFIDSNKRITDLGITLLGEIS
jgi:hypothetical protein